MAGEVATGSIPKPVLRGLHQASIKRNLIISAVLVTLTGVLLKVFVNDPRKNDYAEFYKTYDANKSFKRMVEAGLLDSVKEL